MSKTDSFLWKRPYGAADGQELCEWNGLALWADMHGEWRVVRMGANGRRGEVLITSADQINGKDIDEAKQRAQAAAIVQHSLREQNPVTR